jgi:tRNA U34 5-carboxymethylaminomethyl modifying enzyme MnmG/GidA
VSIATRWAQAADTIVVGGGTAGAAAPGEVPAFELDSSTLFFVRHLGLAAAAGLRPAPGAQRPRQLRLVH